MILRSYPRDDLPVTRKDRSARGAEEESWPENWDRAGLIAERERVKSRLGPDETSWAVRLEQAVCDWRTPSRFEALGTKFSRLSADVQSFVSPTVARDVNRLLVVELALKLPPAMLTREISQEILALYPAALRRLLDFLQQGDDQDYVYPNDFLLKDLRFAAGLTVPCGAQVVDLRSVIGYRAWLHLSLRPHIFRHVADGSRAWFRIHTEARYLDEFNEAGWDACYRRIAGLLARHPKMHGMVGTSWFYDPVLESISPHLAYLRVKPLARGALLLRNTTTEHDIRSATAKSQKRRRLFQTGHYMPVSHTLLWPRRALMAWARSTDLQ